MKDDANFDSVRSFGFRAPRISTNFSFLLEVPALGKHYNAVCTDLSEEGLAAEMPEPIPAGTQVIARLLFPGSTQPIQIKGIYRTLPGPALRCDILRLVWSRAGADSVVHPVDVTVMIFGTPASSACWGLPGLTS